MRDVTEMDALALDGSTVRVGWRSPPNWETTSGTTSESASESTSGTWTSSGNVTYDISPVTVKFQGGSGTHRIDHIDNTFDRVHLRIRAWRISSSGNQP